MKTRRSDETPTMTTRHPWEFTAEESEQFRDELEKLVAMLWTHHRGGD